MAYAALENARVHRLRQHTAYRPFRAGSPVRRTVFWSFPFFFPLVERGGYPLPGGGNGFFCGKYSAMTQYVGDDGLLFARSRCYVTGEGGSRLPERRLRCANGAVPAGEFSRWKLRCRTLDVRYSGLSLRCFFKYFCIGQGEFPLGSRMAKKRLCSKNDRQWNFFDLSVAVRAILPARKKLARKLLVVLCARTPHRKG